MFPRVVRQPVLTVVMVPVGALIIRADNPFRDEGGFLRQPAVTRTIFTGMTGTAG